MMVCSHVKLLVGAALLAALVVTLAMRPEVIAQQPKKPNVPARKDSDKQPATETAEGAMMCPMIVGLSKLRMFPDSPAAILNRADDLGLDAKQKKQLEEIEESARQQARKVLTDKQCEKLGKAPLAPLSMMETARMGMKGKKIECCCPMCAETMKKVHSGKAEEKGKNEKDKKKD